MPLANVSIRCPNCQRVQFFPYRYKEFGRGISTVVFELEDSFRVTCHDCGNLIYGQVNTTPQNLMMLYEFTSHQTKPPQGPDCETANDGRR